MGRVFPGTYVYTVVDPGTIRLRTTRQMRYSSPTLSYPIAWHNAWADLEIEADRKYFIELSNSLKPLRNDTGYLEYIDKKYYLRRPSEEQLRIDFDTVQLSFSNRYDAETLGRPKHPTVDHCPWGTEVSHDSDPLPCTYHRSF